MQIMWMLQLILVVLLVQWDGASGRRVRRRRMRIELAKELARLKDASIEITGTINSFIDGEACEMHEDAYNTCLQHKDDDQNKDAGQNDQCPANPCQHDSVYAEKAVQDANGDAYTCLCLPGYDGHDCENDVDDCATNPCENGGSCQDKVNSYQCFCTDGYGGDRCESDINECVSDPCQHGSVCEDEVAGYTCLCTAGYAGDNCEEEKNIIDECASKPCQHDGVCTDEVNGYNCVCTAHYSGDNCETYNLAMDCHALREADDSIANGIYDIYPEPLKGTPVSVYCKFDENTWAATVFQRRMDGSVDFYRGWTEYEDGFGDMDGEFWLGLKTLNIMTNQRRYNMRINLVAEDDMAETAPAWVNNDGFRVGDGTENYRLYLSGLYHASYPYLAKWNQHFSPVFDGAMFSTFDRDNDPWDAGSYAEYRHGGFWYNGNGQFNGNGLYQKGEYGVTTVFDMGFRGLFNLKWVDMSIYRPSACAPNPCQNGASCLIELNNYKCVCTAGYVGYDCDRDVNECGDGCARAGAEFPIDCHEIREGDDAVADGVYTIYPRPLKNPISVYCKFDDDTWASTVFQRRQDGSVDFYKGWADYEDGFGDVNGEFWLGLRALHTLTSQKVYNLRIDMVAEDGETAWTDNGEFSIADSSEKYRLYIQYTQKYTRSDSKLTDLIRWTTGNMFSTFDSDHDNAPNMNYAADRYKGGWWYATWGTYINLNGQYQPNTNDFSTVFQNDFKTLDNLKSVEMRVWRQ